MAEIPFPGLRLIELPFPQGEEGREVRSATLFEKNHLPQGLDFRPGRLDNGKPLCIGQDAPATAVVQDVGHFGLLQHGIDQIHGDPGPRGPQVRDDQLGTARQKDGQHIPLPVTHLRHAESNPGNQLVQLRIGHLTVFEEDRCLARGLRHVRPDEVGHVHGHDLF